jgi:hypothetical protein
VGRGSVTCCKLFQCGLVDPDRKIPGFLKVG